jgi:hypothetical protein
MLSSVSLKKADIEEIHLYKYSNNLFSPHKLHYSPMHGNRKEDNLTHAGYAMRKTALRNRSVLIMLARLHVQNAALTNGEALDAKERGKRHRRSCAS